MFFLHILNSINYQFRQAANDKYYKTLTFKLLWCQPEPVEGGFAEAYRLRQTLPDTQIRLNFFICKELKIYFMSVSI